MLFIFFVIVEMKDKEKPGLYINAHCRHIQRMCDHLISLHDATKQDNFIFLLASPQVKKDGDQQLDKMNEPDSKMDIEDKKEKTNIEKGKDCFFLIRLMYRNI